MARKVKDKTLDSREGRAALKARGKPYYRVIEESAHLGYRRLKGRSGTWCGRYYTGEQQYTVEGLGAADDLSDADGVAILSYWQAVEKVRDRRKQLAHTAAGISGPYTVKQAIGDYIENLDNEGRSTYDAQQRANIHILPTLGETELAQLTTDQLKKWHAGLAKERPRVRTANGGKQNYRDAASDDEAKRARRASANRTLTVLKAALNFAWRNKKHAKKQCPSDAEWRSIKPFKGVDKARVRYLEVAEAQRLANATDPEFRPMVQAALLTGGRYGQLADLVVADFNRDAGTIRMSTRKGDGTKKVYHIHLTDDEGVRFFKQVCLGRNDAKALIFAKANGGAWKKSEQDRPIRAASKRANIKPAVNFHCLRHTYASHAVMRGVPLLVVAKNLGHSDTRMVEKHYGHLAPDYIKQAIRDNAPRFGFEPDKKLAELGR